jgi:hypothetical protein
MIGSRRIGRALCATIPLVITNDRKDTLDTFYTTNWQDYSKCSKDKLFNANKMASEEYEKLKGECDDSLLKFHTKCNNELSDQIEQLLTPANIKDNRLLLEIIKISKIKINVDRFVKVSNLDESYKNYQILFKYDLVNDKDYKDYFAKVLKNEMELSCKQGQTISIKKYRKQYPLLKATVRKVFFSVAEKNRLSNCDLTDLRNFINYKKVEKNWSKKYYDYYDFDHNEDNEKNENEYSAIRDYVYRLIEQKMENLFADAIASGDKNRIIETIELLRKNTIDVNIVTLARELKDPQIIDYFVSELLQYKILSSYKITDVDTTLPQGAVFNAGCSDPLHKRFYQLLFLSTYFDNTILTNHIIKHPDIKLYLTGSNFEYFCEKYMKYSYENDDYTTFAKYCCMLENFEKYKTFLKLITVRCRNKFTQKNNLLELYGTHKNNPCHKSFLRFIMKGKNDII